MLTKKDLEKLAELARLDIKPHEEDKLLKDLTSILDHFEELKEINTDNIAPLLGGTSNVNAFREDEETENLPKEKALEQFPKKSKGFLKVPPVFE